MKKNTNKNRLLKTKNIAIGIVLLIVFILLVSFIQKTEIINTKNNLKISNVEYDYGGVLQSQAKIECDKTTFSALTETNDVVLIATLITDKEEFCKLYKNPSFIIYMPENVSIESIANLAVLGDANLSIADISVIDGNKINISLTGQQTSFNTGDINAQIRIPAKIKVNKMIRNFQGEIKMDVTNENDVATRSFVTPIIVNSLDGIISYSKIEGFNDKSDVLEFYNNENTHSFKLDMDTTAKTAVINGKILNNYNKDLKNVKITFAPEWTHANGTKEVSSIVSDSFINNEMIIGDFTVGQVAEFTAQIAIPQDLYFNELLNLSYTVNYEYEEEDKTAEMNVIAGTEHKDGVGIIEKFFETANGSLRVETLSQVGTDIISNNSNVYEGSTIRYTMTVTNLTEEIMENVKIKMTKQNNNTNFYDLVEYGTSIMDESLFVYEKVDNEFIEKSIGNIEPGQIKTIYFEVVVGENVENLVVSNLVDVFIGDTTEQSSTITNNITDGELKLSLIDGWPLIDGVNTITKQENEIELEYNLDTKNTQGKTGNSPILIQMQMNDIIKDIEVYKANGIDKIPFTLIDGVLQFELENITNEENDFVKLFITIPEFEGTELNLQLSYKATMNDITYSSNRVQKTIINGRIDTEITVVSSIAETTPIKVDDVLQYIVTVKNKGYIPVTIGVSDIIPNTLTFNKVILDGAELSDYTITEDNELVYEFLLNQTEQKSFIIEVKITENEDVSNIINVIVETEEQSYEFNHIAADQEGETEYEFVETEFVETDETVKQKYKISGMAWLDNNKDGIKSNNDTILKDVQVRLIDVNNKNSFVKDSNGNILSVKTSENGLYEFPEVPEGKYFVVFEYNVTNYETTIYQKQGIDEAINSNVEDATVTIDGSNKKVAITKAIDLSQNVSNINMGIRELLKFDLKIDKYISKVTVKTSQGLTTYNYDKKSTIKVEIPSKEMQGAVVTVEYNIVITNQGEIAGYVTNLVDEIPEDLIFYTESNKDWYKSEKEKNILNNIGLSNITIEPGKTANVSLVLVKTMNKENQGVSKNTAEIKNYTNTAERVDNNLENNKSEASLIISVKTGKVALYLSIVTGFVAIIAFGIYIIKKKVI